ARAGWGRSCARVAGRGGGATGHRYAGTMKNRFYVDADLAAGAIVALSDEERHHARVLRVRDGEEVEVFDGRGSSFFATFESADAIVLTRRTANREPRIAIHLAMSIIPIDKFE